VTASLLAARCASAAPPRIMLLRPCAATLHHRPLWPPLVAPPPVVPPPIALAPVALLAVAPLPIAPPPFAPLPVAPLPVAPLPVVPLPIAPHLLHRCPLRRRLLRPLPVALLLLHRCPLRCHLLPAARCTATCAPLPVAPLPVMSRGATACRVIAVALLRGAVAAAWLCHGALLCIMLPAHHHPLCRHRITHRVSCHSALRPPCRSSRLLPIVPCPCCKQNLK